MNDFFMQPPPPVEEKLEEKIISVKKQRYYLLLETDWSQLSDVSQLTKNKWAPYRQELRNVTLQSGFPTNIIWPIKPA